MNLPEHIRQLVKQAQTTGPRLNLLQISHMSKVEYGRLWRFMDPRRSGLLRAEDAQKLYDALSRNNLLQPDTTDDI